MVSRVIVLTVLLFAAAAVAYLAGNGATPLFDRDEPRYALTAENMVRTGDLVVPRQYDKPRTAKPPLIYWAQALSMRLCGTGDGRSDATFAARLPSAVAMLAVLGMLTAFLAGETDAATRLAATAVFASSGLTLFLAKAAITDATLLAFVAPSMFAAYRAWRGDRRWRVAVAYGVSTGLALLTKGPVALGVQGTTLAALGALALVERRWPARASWRTFPLSRASPRGRSLAAGAGSRVGLKACVAAGIALGIALPWAVAVERASPGFLTAAFRHDLVERTTRGVDGQGRPPGFYFVVLYGTFFPWSLLLPATFVVAWRNRHRPLTRFCLAACVGPWVMFEASRSKMPHWFMPVFLPLSILTGELLVTCWRGAATDLANRAFRATVWIWAAAVVAMGVAPWFLVRRFEVPWWGAGLMSAWAVGLAGGGAWLFLRGELMRAVGLLAGAMAGLVTVAFAGVLPHTQPLLLGREVGEALRGAMAARSGAPASGPGAEGRAGRGPLRVIMDDSYNEPSVAFYQGGTAREADGATRGDPLLRSDIDLLTCAESNFLAHAVEVRARWKVVARERGLMYAKSARPVTVLVLAPSGEAPAQRP